jgi:hypothetical protein
MINTWNKIVDWFRDKNDRNNLLRYFNDSAKMAFVSGIVPTYLKSKISKGNSKYKHRFSHFFNTGFRVEILSGQSLTKNELQFIGEVILNDNKLVRQLVVLGFDTLELHGERDSYGLQWQLVSYMELN